MRKGFFLFSFPGVLLTAAALSSMSMAPAAGDTGYEKPPPLIDAFFTAPRLPRASVNPTGDYLMIETSPGMPPIADVARPMARIAGLRIDAQSNSLRYGFLGALSGLSLVNVGRNEPAQPLALPAGGHFSAPVWSADGTHFAVVNLSYGGGDLWVGNTQDASVKKIDGIKVNSVERDSVRWMPDGRTLVVSAIPKDRGPAPSPPLVPAGPPTQETRGGVAGVWTYEDLLTNPYDEQLYDYYATSQLTLVDTASGNLKPIGSPGIFADSTPSPNGQYLLVARIHRPYSYLYPETSFPRAFQIWDANGNTVASLYDAPLQDNVVIDGVPDFPRDYSWKPTAPATVVWFKALDGGDPSATKTPRDRVFSLDAPFTGTPTVVATVQQRAQAIQWIENSNLALLSDENRSTRTTRTFLIDTSTADPRQKLVFTAVQGDRYNDPGRPMEHISANGQLVVTKKGDNIFLTGDGYAPDGQHPFLDLLNLTTLQKQRAFRSELQPLENVEAVLDDTGSRLLTMRQSTSVPPNYFIRSNGGLQQVTNFSDPMPQLRTLQRRLVHYKRPDGIDLSFELILPPNYKPGTRLPTFVWAYPAEFINAKLASQNINSAQTFQSVGLGSEHILLAFEGYAVLENAAIPIVGPQMTANDTYVQQLVAGAKAAIDEAVALGVTDPKRVGVGGHSYGAFMTANLLVHSNLFRAGDAQSGAYNRTLTPFGFQNERRTFWQDPGLYIGMSPFTFANKLHGALLMIHGQADDNPGTFPIQSERMYQAIRGNGGTARLIMLPFEGHGYEALESNETVMAELLSWMDRFVKNAK